MYEKAFGEEISIENAREMTNRLLVLYELLMQLFSDKTSPAPTCEGETYV
jgi:hypothetical protein